MAASSSPAQEAPKSPADARPASALRAWLQANAYRLLAALAFLLALALTLLAPHDPQRLHMPEPWSYALAAEQFAQGNWTLSNEQVAGARTQVRLQGSRLTQYVEIEPGRWAFRQSPGHPLQLALFYVLGQPRLAGAVLALLATLALYPVLAAWRDERLAFLGVTLLSWTPVSLLALHYTSMDTFAGGVWPLIAGALLLGYERLAGRNAVAGRPGRNHNSSRPAEDKRRIVVDGAIAPLVVLFLAGFAAASTAAINTLQRALRGECTTLDDVGWDLVFGAAAGSLDAVFTRITAGAGPHINRMLEKGRFLSSGAAPRWGAIDGRRLLRPDEVTLAVRAWRPTLTAAALALSNSSLISTAKDFLDKFLDSAAHTMTILLDPDVVEEVFGEAT